MSHYGVTELWKDSKGKITSCTIHKFEAASNGGLSLGDEQKMHCRDVAELILSGNSVWIMTQNVSGEFEKHEQILADSHSRESRLYTEPGNALFDRLLARPESENDSY